MMNDKISIESRKEMARELHRSGYNCSQCVFMAFEDVHGLSRDVAAKISAGLGGGVGGQRQVCGALTGLSMVVGCKGYTSPSDKMAVYEKVKVCCREFKERNGSIVCAELVGPLRKPCVDYIENAVEILANALEDE